VSSPSKNKKQLTENEVESLIDTIKSLNREQQEEIRQTLLDLQERPEPRMSATMSHAATALGWEWAQRSPADHPYGAQLDGELRVSGRRLGVVELESSGAKRIRAALLDLLAYPDAPRVLVIGTSGGNVSRGLRPAQLKNQMTKEVIPAIGRMTGLIGSVGVFTETEISQHPEGLRDWINSQQALHD
jgi:hypothetical protein